MLDLNRLRRIRLHRRPVAQVFLADLPMRIDYNFPRRTHIELVGVENLPRDRSVFFAMNHTDRYNYWPFQYQMHRHGGLRYTATWVKGKYYENRLMGAFMDATNNIPLPSRGYVLTTLFRQACGRVPGEAEYEALRGFTDGRLDGAQALAQGGEGVGRWLERLGGAAKALAGFEAHFALMMAEVTRLTRQALTELELNVLVFPQGTRSLRLLRGHTGLMQMAQHLDVPIVPVGCNGSEHAYPGASPFSKGGHLIYRIGAPLELDGPELGPHRVSEPFVPFSAEASARHGAALQAATDVVMDRINALLDPQYRYDEASTGEGGSEGISRFV